MEESYHKIRTAMEERYRELTGFSPDDASDIGIRMKVLAWELAGLYDTFHTMEGELFPQTSTGAYLELHAQTRGLVRKGGTRAVGLLRFSRTTPAPGDIPIPAGTLCAIRGEPVCRFVTTEEGVLPAGRTEITVPAVAEEPGAAMNVGAGAVVVMITPVAQVGEVQNPTPFVGGSDAEDDRSLRERLLASYQRVANGTNAASYQQKALEFDGITSAKVLPRRRGSGTVDVVVTCAGQPPEAELLAAMGEEMGRWKEINVDLRVLPARTKAVPIRLAVKTAEVMEAPQFAALGGELVARVLELLTKVQVGEPLRLAHLTHTLLQDSRVLNCHVLEPAADVAVEEDEVIIPGSLGVEKLEEV